MWSCFYYLYNYQKETFIYIIIFDVDIQEFYEYTLDNAAKSLEVKAEETRQLVEKWDGQNPPVPVETRRLAQQTIAPTNERMVSKYIYHYGM